MWKQVGFILTLLSVGLGSGSAEARFGKRSRPSSTPPSADNPPHPSSGVGTRRPNPFYGHGYYGYYPDPWVRYYYDPSWAWPYLGPVPFYRPYGRYYDLMWRRRPVPRPSTPVEDGPEQPTRVDFTADGGLVAQGVMMGLGVQVDGTQFGLGGRLNVLNLATDDGSPGRDTLSLLSLKPSVLLVSRESLRVHLSGGLDVAFAPDATFIGPGVGTSALARVVGPLKLEASAQWTPFPFTHLTGDAGLALELGPVRVRGGYRAIYLNDQGRVDGHVNRELFAGPYAGLALRL